MALVKGINSYVTVEEAEEYFTTRIDVAAWEGASATQKEQALVTATSVLDNLRWEGMVVSESQSLAFPRVGSYFDPKAGRLITLDGINIPDRVIKATFEMAYHLLNNDGLQDSTGSVESISIGSINLTEIKTSPEISAIARKFIKPLLSNGGSRSWWRFN